MTSYRIIEGDLRDQLGDLEAGSVQTCVTSPPYWGLRDYGASDQLGLEPTPERYVENLVSVFREVKRVLRDDGTLWLNLGDSYASNPHSNQGSPSSTLLREPNRRNRAQTLAKVHSDLTTASPSVRGWKPPPGLKPKDLVGIPWMVAFALRADGWYLRSDIIWAKPNPMPESVTDRPTKAHEYLFLLAKSPRYYYDADAIREEPTGHGGALLPSTLNGKAGVTQTGGVASSSLGLNDTAGRNKRSVWTVTTQPFPGAHFATFPPKLIEPCILAGSPPDSLVLDPFCGSGTTGVVALRHDRDFVGIELNPEYAQMARNRIYDDGPLLNVETDG